MRIKRMTATFGKLRNSTLELGPGLNVITAPNESGKTTWCAFLDAMLYGVDTSERDRNGYLSAKTRYRPWDGGSMVGTMELESHGRDITVQRTAKGSAPMKNFLAVYTGTADFIRDLTSDTAGESFTGVARPVFQRTAFIRRPDIRVSGTPELERRIAGIVSTGDESTSYTESDAALRRWQRKLRYNKTGAIPALEQELRDARQSFALIESSSDEIAGLRGNMTRQAKQIELMEEDLRIHDKLDKRARHKAVEKAKKDAETSGAIVEELERSLTRNGKLLTREDTNSVREAAAAVTPLRRVAQDAERTLWRAERELSDASNRRASSPLSGRDEADVEADIAKARELEGRVGREKEPRIPVVFPVIFWVLALLGLMLTTGILAPLAGSLPALERFAEFSIPGIGLSLLVGALGLVMFFLKLPKKPTAAEELAGLLGGYGVQSPDRLAALLNAYRATCREEEQFRAARDAARTAYESAGAAAQEAGEKAVAEISRIMPEITSGEGILEALVETEERIDALKKARFDAASAQNVYETLLDGYDPEEPVDDSYLPTPLRSREDTVAAIARTRQQLTDATRAYDLATGAQRTLGDPAVVSGQIQELSRRIDEGQRQYSALTLAIETLSEANSEIQTRFSPEVSRLASDIMCKLTGGRYERLTFDRGFDAGAKESGRPETRSAAALSDGTADEIYLSLRLALCQLILGGDDPCPIVLDDALANFDDARCRSALEVLREMSGQRQIILFSCHSREADMMEGAENVTVTRF